ncbi:MAG: TldD/PmbA family protein [Candidatus Hodarchaeota archaeon]
MDNELDVSRLAEYGLQLAEKYSNNLKDAEIYFEFSKYINIEIEENSVKNSELGTEGGVSIRLINSKGSLGFASTNILEKNNIEKMVKIGAKMMQSGTEDPDFKNLPRSFTNYPNLKNLYDENIENLTIEDSISYIKDLINICNEDKLAISQSGGFVSSSSRNYIFNTNDLSVKGKETICSVSSNVIVKDKISKDTTFGFHYQSERSLKDINAENVINKALNNGKRNLNRKKIKSMKCPLLLTPNGTISLILKPIAHAINAETFQYNRSFLVGKRDTMIGTKNLTIEDNALIDGAVGSAIFDGEGVPCKNKTIIDKGKFLKTGLLHNYYTAGKEGVESTGNASRNSYSSVPSIGITNLILKSGENSYDELIADIKNGILLNYTGDRPNTSTGDFSGLILQGNLISNGEIKEPLNETLIGINLIDLFSKIEAISKEIMTYGAFQAPYVKIESVPIIGSLS